MHYTLYSDFSNSRTVQGMGTHLSPAERCAEISNMGCSHYSFVTLLVEVIGRAGASPPRRTTDTCALYVYVLFFFGNKNIAKQHLVQYENRENPTVTAYVGG